MSYSTEIHRRCQKYTYITGCIVGENIDENWNVDGERELPDAWTRFTRFILLNERPPNGYTWSGRRLTRTQTTSRPDNVWPEMWKHMSDAAKSKAKQEWAIEKPKLDDARQLRGIFFIKTQTQTHCVDFGFACAADCTWFDPRPHWFPRGRFFSCVSVLSSELRSDVERMDDSATTSQCAWTTDGPGRNDPTCIGGRGCNEPSTEIERSRQQVWHHRGRLHVEWSNQVRRMAEKLHAKSIRQRVW